MLSEGVLQKAGARVTPGMQGKSAQHRALQISIQPHATLLRALFIHRESIWLPTASVMPVSVLSTQLQLLSLAPSSQKLSAISFKVVKFISRHQGGAKQSIAQRTALRAAATLILMWWADVCADLVSVEESTRRPQLLIFSAVHVC